MIGNKPGKKRLDKGAFICVASPLTVAAFNLLAPLGTFADDPPRRIVRSVG